MSRKYRKNKTPVWKVILCIIFFPFLIYYFMFKGVLEIIRCINNNYNTKITKSFPTGNDYIYKKPINNFIDNEIETNINMHVARERMISFFKRVLIVIILWFVVSVLISMFDGPGGEFFAIGVLVIPAGTIIGVIGIGEYNKKQSRTEITKEITNNVTEQKTYQEPIQHPQAPVYEAYLKPKEPTPEEIMEAADRMEGHVFEHFVADILKGVGYYNVEVTPGSGDYGVDILAEMNGVRYAFQCKCYSSPLGLKPIQEVNAGKYHYKAHVGVVVTNSTFTPAAIEIAEDTGVLLWDRNKLIHEIALMSRMKSL